MYNYCNIVLLLRATHSIPCSTHSIVQTSLNNSFFSSALREWVDQVAMGGFAPEHRAKLRADEKRKNAASKLEETWKSKFFEENWGDK